MTAPNQEFVPASYLRRLFGVTDMTLHRWEKGNNDFPKPTRFNRLRYWRKADIDAWEKRRFGPRTNEKAA